jgi:hypothetical protein
MTTDQGPTAPPPAGGDEPVLPEQSADDRGAGWGDEVRDAEQDPDDLRRFLDERPPHHG